METGVAFGAQRKTGAPSAGVHGGRTRSGGAPGEADEIATTAWGLFHSATSGSGLDVIFKQLDEGNGLANPVVTSFAEDGDGFLWVGSQSGLQRWDGYRFWNYKTEIGVETSIPDNLVQTLYTDWKGRIWLGTSSGGLAMYDREHDRFIRYRPHPTT